MFVTIASQRPADISPTIVSQLHNFFIHRLVNDRDLFLIDNTISTMDALSRGLIPGLAQGCCVATGTAFDLPMLIQVEHLSKEKQPDGEDVDLDKLWGGCGIGFGCVGGPWQLVRRWCRGASKKSGVESITTILLRGLR
jgi:uncharacterized protein